MLRGKLPKLRNSLTRECQSLGISNAQIVILDRETHGQAETVELGLVQSGVGDHEPVTIFDIDTFRNGLDFSGS